MQLRHLSRRSFLASLATSSALSLAGCSGPGGLLGGTETPVRAVPDSAVAPAEQATVHCLRPSAVQPHATALDDADASSLFSYYDMDSGLGYRNLDLVFRATTLNLLVFEGSFSTKRARELYAAATPERVETYRGYELREFGGSTKQVVALRDGRGISLWASTALPDPRAGLEAVIDALAGEADPHLPAHPDFGTAHAFLDTDLLWMFYGAYDSRRLPSLRSLGNSVTIVDGEFRVRAAYGIPRDAGVSESDVREFATKDDFLEFTDPSIRRDRDVVLVAERKPLTAYS